MKVALKPNDAERGERFMLQQAAVHQQFCCNAWLLRNVRLLEQGKA